MLPVDTRVLADAEAVAEEACRLIGVAAQAAIRERGIFRIVLAGGSTPGRTYQLLAATAQNWTSWEILWGDERCLPAAAPERNPRQAQELWLQRVAIPAAQIHPIAAELGAEEASARYGKIIADRQPFDLVLLGMGEDGHTASLFPGAVEDCAPVIAVHDAPKPPAGRVSLNFQILRASRAQLVLVTGGEKSFALAAWQHGEQLPIARAAGSGACLLVDAAVWRSARLLPTIS
jgi:6-phosphogluconolactonase